MKFEIRNDIENGATPGSVDASDDSGQQPLDIANVIASVREKIEARDHHVALALLDNAYSVADVQEKLPLDGLKADCYRELGNIAEAVKCYENILKYSDNPPYWVHVGFANALEADGQYETAIQRMLVALRQNYTSDLAERIIRTENSGTSTERTVDSITESCLDIDDIKQRKANALGLGQWLIQNGYNDQGSAVFDRISSEYNNLTPLRRKVKCLIKAGNVEGAIAAIENWGKSNAGDTRLDRLYSICKESKTLSSRNGLPIFCPDDSADLEGFELLIDGLRVNKGLVRFARKVSSASTIDGSNRSCAYCIVLPPEYVDTKNDSYRLTITHSSRPNIKYQQSYLVSKLVLRDGEIHKGDFEYLGANRIHGWYRSTLNESSGLSLFLNGQYVKDITPELERPDAAEINGSSYLYSGFDCSWDRSIDVKTLELRDTVSGCTVLSTPITVQRRDVAISELENALLHQDIRINKNIAGAAAELMFDSLRSMPDVSIEYTVNSREICSQYADGISVIIPVYNGLDDLKNCISSLMQSYADTPHEIICVNDCSPDSRVLQYLEQLQEVENNIFLVNSKINRGFVKSVNKGLCCRAYKDVILLNSDTIAPLNFIDRMRVARDIDSSFGVISPLSNNATIFSFPLTLQDNKLKNSGEISRIDAMLHSNAVNEIHEVPTGHGYCMFIAGAVMEDIGFLDEEKWGVGYGEENDFCQKAKMRGWRIGSYMGMYVGHVGSVSFGNEKRDAQVSKNLKRLNKLYPEYDKIIQNHIMDEGKSRLVRNRLQILNWNQEEDAGSILFLTHSLGGGTTEYIDRSTDNLAQQNIKSLILTTEDEDLVLHDSTHELYCKYRSDEIEVLKEHISSFKLLDVVLNSTFNFPSELFESILGSAGNYSVVLHDYSWFCPRINLIDATGSYCGMPSSEVCVKCIEVSGTHESFKSEWKNISAGMDVWLTKNKNLLENARKIIAPSTDTANRIRQKFPSLNPSVKHHSDSFSVSTDAVRYKAGAIEDQKIAIFGMIGDHKGMQVLKKLCWLLSSKHSGVQVTFFGAMSESEWMNGYSNVKCVGEYDQDTLPHLIAREKPTVSLFLSMWPETYCYALTDAIKHCVYPIAFDLGAFSERIKMHAYGSTVPFETDSEKLYNSIVDVMCSDEFQSARKEDIKNGVVYQEYTSDYLDMMLSESSDSSGLIVE